MTFRIPVDPERRAPPEVRSARYHSMTGRMGEREAIVAWLRETAELTDDDDRRETADAIERGEHLNVDGTNG